ncbi:cell division protein FtsL [Oceanicella actignis]|uniref:Cell division protein FtsL n=1 Tax=Oceanicella actignis TaxID=1189325 RepID=A0A1M7SB76_9RHOB|nr:hypothetical protein [Oceanicella actignis]SET28208.1 hypothetical protein SAMN04488119_103342 [Oceanicella actignis]SHN55723.1 hypothetical protein SAMN05216200_102166 [Oceanicella actignis]
MRSLLYVLALAFVAAVAVWAYRVNYQTLEAADRVAALREEIAREREALEILRVEWAHLNAPERLARLARRHADALGLAPMGPDHFAETAMAAFPPPAPLPPAPPPVEPPLLAPDGFMILSALEVTRHFGRPSLEVASLSAGAEAEAAPDFDAPPLPSRAGAAQLVAFAPAPAARAGGGAALAALDLGAAFGMERAR